MLNIYFLNIRSDSYTTAWMLYQLKDVEEASKVFIGENAELLNNKNWQDVKKNKLSKD